MRPVITVSSIRVLVVCGNARTNYAPLTGGDALEAYFLWATTAT